MRIARTFKSHAEFDRFTASALLAMIALNAISIPSAFMMDQPPFPASLSLGVALILVLRFDRRFAAYYAMVATLFGVATWLGRGGSSAESISVATFISTLLLQGLALLATPWLLGSRGRDLVNASPSVGGVLRLLLVVIPFVSLAPAVAVLVLARSTGVADPFLAGVTAAVQGIVGCYATAPIAIALLRDQSGRRCCSCNCERRWLILTILLFITSIGVAHHPVVTSGHVLMQILLALGSLSMLVFLAVLSGWMATAVGTFLLTFTTGVALVATSTPGGPSPTDAGLIAPTGFAMTVKIGSVLPVIAIALVVAALTEVHHRAYRSLKDRDGRLGGLLDDDATGLIRTDARGRILFANEAAVTVIGADPLDGVEGHPEILIQTLLAPASHRRLRRGLRAAGRGRRFECELEVAAADGSVRIHLALFSPVRDPREADSVLITMIDIDARERRTRRRRRRDAIRHRRPLEAKRLDRMTSLVMSDVNNLATALAGVASLPREDRSPAELDHLLLTLEAGCENAARHAARLRHAIPGAAVSKEKTDVAGHLRDRLHRAVSMGRIRLDHIDVPLGISAPVRGAFLDLMVEELIHDLEADHRSAGQAVPVPVPVSVSVSDRRVGSNPAVRIEFGSSDRRSPRSIAALTSRRDAEPRTEPPAVGLVTIADRVEEIGGTIDVRDDDVGTVVTIHIPAEPDIGSTSTRNETCDGRLIQDRVGFNRRA